MGDWPAMLGDAARYETAGAVTATSLGTTVTTSATIHTKGAYAELIASTAFDADGFTLVFSGAPGGTAVMDFLADLAVGAGGSEQVIVSNLLFTQNSVVNGQSGRSFYFPISIPAGTRLSCRAQALTTGAKTCTATVVLHGPAFIPSSSLSRVTTYGAATADTGGTAIDGGASANTKGAWAQLTASSTAPVRWLMVRLGSTGLATRSNVSFLVDIGVGAAASEQVIVANLLTFGTVLEIIEPDSFSFPVSIPAGSRIAARCQASSNSAGNRAIDIVLYGMD